MGKLLFFPVGISPKNESDEHSQRRYASLLISLYPEMDFRVIDDEVCVFFDPENEEEVRRAQYIIQNLPENW